MNYILRSAQDEYDRVAGLRAAFATRAEELKAYSGYRLCVDNRKQLPRYSLLARSAGKDGSITPDPSVLQGLQAAEDGSSKKNIYLGRNHMDLVDGISKAALCDACLKKLERNQAALEQFLRTYDPFDLPEILQSLPQAYQEIRDPMTIAMDRRKQNWLLKMEKRKALDPPPFPDSLIHRAADGKMMSSISETDMAQLLISWNLPYAYAAPLELCGILRFPDFTIYLVQEDRVVYVEFMGKMDDPAYEERNTIKISEFINAGYIHGRDFLCIFAGRDGADCQVSATPS